MVLAPVTEVQSLSGAHRTISALAAGLCVALTVAAPALAHATEPDTSPEYRSAFQNYRAFDARTGLVDWRRTNDAIRDGVAGAMHSSEAKQKDEAPTPAHHHDHAATTPADNSAPSNEPSPSPPPNDPHAGHDE